MQQVGRFAWMLVFISMTGLSYAQEFPIAVGNDDTFSAGAAFDGTNYLIGLVGDSANRFNITAQLVSRSGSLSGPRILLGHTGGNPMIAFDGTNYLVAWADSFPRMAGGDTSGISDIEGQFISTSGNLVGSRMTFATGANIRFGQGRGGLAYHDTTYFLTYVKGGLHADYLYGQRISRSGNLVGGPVKISSGYARESAIAFDGTNYLAAWCEYAHPGIDKDIYGQFVSPSGALVGTNFLIDGGPSASDNPVSMTFDGSRYWVGFHDQAADSSGRWNLVGRFVSTSGGIAERFIICDSSKSPTFATAAFDGTKYLITWMEFAGVPCVRGRFFSASGVPLDTAFTAFGAKDGKFPIGGVGGYNDGHFMLGVTRVDSNLAGGDVYWMFIPGSTTAIRSHESSLGPEVFTLAQNYPNPFNPTTTIQFSLRSRALVSLKIYNLLGEEVAMLLDGEMSAGDHSRTWDAAAFASGVYFYRLQADGFVSTKKLVLLR